jgi:Cu/Ag efflux protein CusF
MKLAHFLVAASLVLTALAHAQPKAPDQTVQNPAATASTSAAPTMTEGEVRKVDREQGKVTLKHGPIDNLGMPGMTMVFKVSDPKLLDSVKAGDKVKFAADNINGALTVTAIEATK